MRINVDATLPYMVEAADRALAVLVLIARYDDLAVNLYRGFRIKQPSQYSEQLREIPLWRRRLRASECYRFGNVTTPVHLAPGGQELTSRFEYAVYGRNDKPYILEVEIRLEETDDGRAYTAFYGIEGSALTTGTFSGFLSVGSASV